MVRLMDPPMATLPRRPAALAFFLVLMVLSLAGCLGPGSVPAAGPRDPSATPSLFNEERGAVVGTVQTLEGNPVPLARATLMEQRISTLTNKHGQYNFSLLLPGLYRVAVTVGDQDAVEQEARVHANGITGLDFTVEVNKPIRHVIYNTTIVERGYMTCNVASKPCPGYDTSNDILTFEHHFEGKPIAFLYEVVWERRGPPWLLSPSAGENGFPGGLERWQILMNLGDAGSFAISSPPYMRARFNFTSEDAVPEGPVHVRVQTWPGAWWHPGGAAYETPFDLYMTAFYAEDRSLHHCAAPPEVCRR